MKEFNIEIIATTKIKGVVKAKTEEEAVECAECFIEEVDFDELRKNRLIEEKVEVITEERFAKSLDEIEFE